MTTDRGRMTLSVVIAAHNEEAYLSEQLCALYLQREWVDEIIIVDDGSDDRTPDIIRAFTPLFGERMRSTRFDWNKGCAEATNAGVRAASGTFVYIASANDVVQPGAMRAIREAISYRPTADLIVGDLAGIHLGWGEPQGNVVTPSYIDPDTFAAFVGHAGIIHAAGAVIRRWRWSRHGGWDPAFWPYSETLTWHVTAARHGLVYTPNPIAWVRTHAGSASRTVLDREWRRPLMAKAAEYVDGLEEPARSRLIRSGLWGIPEWAPDMALLLHRERVTA